MPELSDLARSSYIVGLPWTLVQADTTPDYTNLDTRLAITTQLLTHSINSSFYYTNGVSHGLLDDVPNTTAEKDIITAIEKHRSPDHISTPVSRTHFSNALDLLAEAPSSSLTAPAPMTASSLDREFSIIVKDIAPYIRGIAAHDLHIEQQRLKVSNLLSAGGGAKKMRMTRASRSAVEGGRRETTRRERWFDKALDLVLVLRTGGEDWSSLARRSLGGEGSVSSTREGSVQTIGERDTAMGIFRGDDERSADSDAMDELA